jgi:Reeler domain
MKAMNMKNTLLASSTICLIALISLGNEGGRADFTGKGNTGAPGDETNTNGTIRTCQSCHNAGPITCSMDIQVLDAQSQPVTAYQPGQTYTTRVSISSPSTGINGYGFQMIALRKQGNTDLKGFKDLTQNNYKLANAQNGRTYAEHSGISADSTFDVVWQAPMAGTGAVQFYSSGNAVNANGLTSGDGASITTLELAEDLGSSVNTLNQDSNVPKVRIFGSNLVSVTGFVEQKGQLRIFNMEGKLYMQQQIELAGVTPIDAAQLKPGMYFISVSGTSGQIATTKFVNLSQ